jgi:hypothetical protein
MDLHFKFALKIERPVDAMFDLRFQGHLHRLAQPLTFAAVGYVFRDAISNFGATCQSGPVTVTRAYKSSDGFLCLVVSTNGNDWHASELSMRLATSASDVWRVGTAELMTVTALEHRSEDF